MCEAPQENAPAEDGAVPPVPKVRGQRALFAAPQAVRQPRPAPTKPVFRTRGETLTVTVPCEAQEVHTVTIDAAGQVVMAAHDAAAVATLVALGAPVNFPCTLIEQAALAARTWVAYRTRQGVPDGYYRNGLWRAQDPLWCCPRNSASAGTRAKQVSTRRFFNDASVPDYPGSELDHARSIQHLAREHNADAAHVEKVARFLSSRAGFGGDQRAIPDQVRTDWASLFPNAEVADRWVPRFFTVGVSGPFLHQVLPALGDPARRVGPNRGADRWAVQHRQDRVYTTVLTWWRASVDPAWVVALAAMVARHRPGMDWVGRVLAWWQAHLSVAEIKAYLAAGVTADPIVCSKYEVGAEQAAQAEQALAGTSASLATWLEAGYPVAEIAPLLAVCRTAWPATVREVRHVCQAIDPHGVTRMDLPRIRAITAIVRTPARAARWHETGLSVAQVAAAVAAKIPPGQARRAAVRGLL